MVWKRPPRAAECGVCLRGEKICHFGAVVYSNVRERAPIRRRLRSTLPAPPPPPSFSIHILTTERDLPLATSGDSSRREKLPTFVVYSRAENKKTRRGASIRAGPRGSLSR